MLALDDSTTRLRARREAKKQRIATRELFKRSHRAERAFSRQLKAVAHQVDAIVKGIAPKGNLEAAQWPMLNAALGKYADLLKPWAKAISEKLIAEVGQRDERSWAEMGRDLGRNLRAEVKGAPTGELMKAMMQEQVELITSLPLEAATRVHQLTQKAITEGGRAKELAVEIMKTGEVTKARAMLIARTETTRTASAMTAARAQHIGSTHFIWRTSRDGDVRPSHKKLEGKAFRWDTPPECDEGHNALPGGIFNCRCYPEVVLPRDL